MSESAQLAAAGTPVPLVRMMLPTAAIGVVCVAAAARHGLTAALSAAAGVVVVLAFFWVTHRVLQRVLESSPHLAMAAAVALYLGKVLALLLLIFIVKRVAVIEPKPFGFAVLAATLAWSVAEVVGHMRQRTLYVDPSADKPTSG